MRIGSFYGKLFALGAAVLLLAPTAFAGGTRATASNLPVGGVSVTLGAGTNDAGGYESGISYLSFTISKGSACTVWTTGSSEISMRIKDAPSYNGDMWGAPWFTVRREADGKNYRGVLNASQWGGSSWSGGSSSYANSVTYYVCITGPAGASVTVNRSTEASSGGGGGTVAADGTAARPYVLTPTAKDNPYPAATKSGKCYFKATLAAGQKYLFGPYDMGGAAGAIELAFQKDKADLGEPVVTEYPAWTNAKGKGWCLKPTEGGNYTIIVSASGSFTLRYKMVGARKPAEHTEATDLGKLTETAVVSSFTPGHRNDPASGSFDSVIDQHLFKFTVDRGATYLFETEGADKDLVMELYDSTGKVLASNRHRDVSGHDCAIALATTAAGTFYVGVCQDLADDEKDEPTAGTCRFLARKIALQPATEEPLSPAIGSMGDDVLAKGAAASAHLLSPSNWVDSYRIAGRAGIAYRLKAKVTDTSLAARWKLKATVSSVVSGRKTTVATIADLASGGSFTATANASYLIEVELAEGEHGVVYPYQLYSLACEPGGKTLGTLAVEIGGATVAEGAAWALVKDGTSATWYNGGDSVLLPEGNWEVKFKAVRNWTTPTNRTASVGGFALTTLSVKYCDTCDVPGNDAVAGDGAWNGKKVTTLAPKAVAAGKDAPSVARSLWADDDEDWFKFNAALNTFYTFRFADSGKLGDAVFEIYAPDHETLLDGPCREVTFIQTGTRAESYYVRVRHSTDGKADSQYALEYSSRTVTALKPAQHKTVAAFLRPDAAGGSATFTPGHRNARTRQNRDNVIDESLFKVTLEKGATYLFETEGADAALRMELYDANGKVLATNVCGKTNGRDCVIAWTATASTDFFLGVCQNLADDDRDEATAGSCTFRVTKIQMAPSAPEALAPVIGQPGDDPVEKGAASRAKLLSPSNWTDTFKLAGRKGVTYRLKAGADDPVCANLWKLRGEVYQLTAAGKRPAKPTQVVEDLILGGVISATANANYEIDVRVADCPGVTYAYALHSLACADVSLGTLSVSIGGATAAEGAALTLTQDGSSAPKYADGDSVILQTGDWTAKFASVKNWTTPTNVTFVIEAGKTNLLSVKYCDTCDVPGNDAVAGDGAWNGKKVTTLAPKAVAAGKAAPSVTRSLWADDDEDWFKFTAALNTSYTFELLGTDEKLGDATIEIYAPVSGTDLKAGRDLIACGRKATFLFRETKAKTYFVRVVHAGAEAVDSQYALAYSSIQVGSVGFAAAKYSVKDGLASVTIPVNRTGGSAGLVRARYTTVHGTAFPGTNYVGQSGILTWGDKVSKATNLVVTLIPDLVAVWEADRTFSLKLFPVEPELEGELTPNFGIVETTVTISDSAAKARGKVQFCGWGAAQEPFANIAAPAATVAAGGRLTLWLERVDGDDGEIGVTVTPTKGKALPETDFENRAETIVWKNGETGAKPFVLRTFAGTSAYAAAKTMTVTLAASKDYADKPALGKAATVTITDGRVSRKVEDYAASFPKTAGITVKPAKTDTWYFDASGILRTVTPAANGKCEMTLTLTGPGKFAFVPYLDKENADDKSEFTCTIGAGGGMETLTFANGGLANGEEVVRYLGKGTTTVKFSLARDRASVGDVIASFGVYGDGQPFLWKPLQAPTLVSPIPGEISPEIQCGGLDKEVPFYWSDAADSEVVYFFSLDENKAKLGKSGSNVENRKCYEPNTAVKAWCSGCILPGGTPTDMVFTGKTYYWRVDSAFIDAEGAVRLVNTNSAVWTMCPIECDANSPQAFVAPTSRDAYGTLIAGAEPIGTILPVRLVQGVAANIALSCSECSLATLSYALAKGSATLPKGLTLKGDVISGVPTAVGTNTCAIQVTATKRIDGRNKAFPGSTVSLRFMVEPIGLAEGTFTGLVATEDPRVADDNAYRAMSVGLLDKMTVSAAGQITANVKIGGATYAFKGTGYDECVEYLDNGLHGVRVRLSTVVSLRPTGAKAAVSCTNTLTLVTCREPVTAGAEALDTPMRVEELKLSFLSADKRSVVSDVVWRGEAYRNNAKVAESLAGMQRFQGAYTVSLNPLQPVTGRSGYGYLSVTVDKNGNAKFGGKLADNSAVSASFAVAYLSEGADGQPALRIPLYTFTKTAMLGGWITLRMDDEEVPYVVSGHETIRWIDTDKAKTYEGTSGFALDLEPVGGYYNTLYNLQRYYLDYEFLLDQLELDELPPEFFGGKIPVIYPGSDGDERLNISLNAITIGKNASNLTFSFVRATGLYSGTFKIQVKNDAPNARTPTVAFGGTYSHCGVLLLTRDPEVDGNPEHPLAFENAVMPGFYLAPMTLQNTGAKRSWTASMPFVVRPERKDDGWYLE